MCADVHHITLNMPTALWNMLVAVLGIGDASLWQRQEVGQILW